MGTEALATMGRYTIERLLGAGMMGSVYLAFDTRLRRRVALKVLGAGAADLGIDAVALLLHEARAASAVSHPNAMAVFDADEADGHPFIAMEYVPGAPLRRFVGDASLPLVVRLRWIVDIASALAAAHAVGVVHRDVKPENVLVRHDGVVKVLDFGVARVAPREGATGATVFRTWSQVGAFVGTPGYMAPEVLRGQEVDGRADQFGWGVLAYELLAGRRPWGPEQRASRALVSSLTEAPEPLGPEVPAAVAAAVERALAKAPEDRFPSLAEAAHTLTPFAGPSGPTSRSHSEPPPRPSSLPTVPRPIGSGTLVSAGIEVPPRPRGPVAPAPRRASTPPPTVAVVDGLRDPDLTAPVDVEGHLALLPSRGTCKGLFFDELFTAAARVLAPAELASGAGIPDREYVGFRDYPVADGLRLLVAVAGVVHPRLPLGEALHRLGQRMIDAVMASHVGRTLFGGAGRNVDPILLHGPKAYRMLFDFGEVTSEKVVSGGFAIRVRRMPLFPETFLVGVLEGALRRCSARSRVWIDLEALDRATFRVRLG